MIDQVQNTALRAAKIVCIIMFKYVYTITCLIWLMSFYLYANNVIERRLMTAAFLLSSVAVFLVVWDILESNLMLNLKHFKKWEQR